MTPFRTALLVLLLGVSPLGAREGCETSVIVEPIVNGVATAEYPSVGQFVQFGRFCTATLIGCQTALTAAHCVCGDLPGAQCNTDPEVQHQRRALRLAQAGVFMITSVEADPQYAIGPQEAFADHDLAVLHLAAPVTGIAPSAIDIASPPAFGTRGTIVGYGMDHQAITGIKRSGSVTLARCTEPGVTQAGHDCWLFDQPLGAPGSNSTICFGDSGGPLFVGTGAASVLAGVHSSADTGDERDECKAPQRAAEADVFTDRAWLAASVDDLGAAACGGLPAAGSALAPVLSAVATLTPAAPDSRLAFRVRRGTTSLRVALTTYFNGSTYELYLRAGGLASPSRFNCKSAASLQSFQYCEVTNPVPGVWNLLARLARGFGGPAQATVTTFLPATSN